MGLIFQKTSFMFDFLHNYTRKRKTGGIIDLVTINNGGVGDSLLLFVIGYTGLALLLYNLHTNTLSRHAKRPQTVSKTNTPFLLSKSALKHVLRPLSGPSSLSAPFDLLAAPTT